MSINNYKELFDSLKKRQDLNEYLDALVQMISQVLYQRDTFVKNSDNQEARNMFYYEQE